MPVSKKRKRDGKPVGNGQRKYLRTAQPKPSLDLWRPRPMNQAEMEAALMASGHLLPTPSVPSTQEKA